MSSAQYDIVTVGGGLGGAALAKVMAEHGSRVLVLERETEFKDRVRGEFVPPWGVAEAQELGIYEPMKNTGGLDIPIVDLGFGPRDLPSTTPQQLSALSFSHPEMQEAVLSAAKVAGAEVRRGATVVNVKPGTSPSVTFHDGRGNEEVTARLVVAADGRTSVSRQWLGLPVNESPVPFYFAGLMMSDVAVPEDITYLLFLPPLGMEAAVTPIGRGRCRIYVAYQDSADFRLQGSENVARFIAEAKRGEPVADYFDNAKAIGPLASFRCGDFWVEHPYKDGVVLLGDAAATCDPAFGQGLSSTMRDARVLSNQLLEHEDWAAASHEYATEHDHYAAIIRKVEHWFRTLFLEVGPEADARRARALPLLAGDPLRAPDHLFSGPELPHDDAVRQRFHGES